jgi:hypothetical protein
MMKLLLDNKSPLDATDIDGMTALHHGMFTLFVSLWMDLGTTKIGRLGKKVEFNTNTIYE